MSEQFLSPHTSARHRLDRVNSSLTSHVPLTTDQASTDCLSVGPAITRTREEMKSS